MSTHQPLLTRDDVVVVGTDDQTHVVHAGCWHLERRGVALEHGPLRARCSATSAVWLPRPGDVVTCPGCVAWLRRRSLTYLATGRARPARRTA